MIIYYLKVFFCLYVLVFSIILKLSLLYMLEVWFQYEYFMNVFVVENYFGKLCILLYKDLCFQIIDYKNEYDILKCFKFIIVKNQF